MNISGIRTGAGFYDYNSIKINEVRNQQIRESMESGPMPVMGAVEQNDSADIEAVQLQTVQKAVTEPLSLMPDISRMRPMN